MVRGICSALLLIGLRPPVPCGAQDPNASSANPQTSQTGAQDAPSAGVRSDKSKRVWTNEDLKTAGSVSVIGDPRNQKYTMTKAPDPATVAKYKRALEKLQAQQADVNKQLQAYQDFSGGKPVSEGGRDMGHGYSRTPVDQQITKLMDKKKDLEGQIDTLYEESRKKGIESGQLK